MENYNHISEEMIASFLEGTANTMESMQVIDAIANDESIANLVSEVNMLDGIDAFSLHDGDYGYYELGIDPVFTREELLEFQELDIPTDTSITDEMFMTDSELLNVACCDDFLSIGQSDDQFTTLLDDSGNDVILSGDCNNDIAVETGLNNNDYEY